MPDSANLVSVVVFLRIFFLQIYIIFIGSEYFENKTLKVTTYIYKYTPSYV